MKATNVLELVDEIEYTVTEAVNVKVGDSVMLKTKELMGVQAVVVNVHPERNSVDVELGHGGLRTEIPAGMFMHVPSHPGVLAPKK